MGLTDEQILAWVDSDDGFDSHEGPWYGNVEDAARWGYAKGRDEARAKLDRIEDLAANWVKASHAAIVFREIENIAKGE